MSKPRLRSGRKYPRRKLWLLRRNEAFARAGITCEVTGDALLIPPATGFSPGAVAVWCRAAHHVIAERFARRWVPGCDPHCLGNLIVITPSLHAKATAAERRLFKVDIIGYKQELNRLGFPPEMFDRAMKAICESVKKCAT